MGAPHYYVYEIESKGLGSEAMFTVSAYGDLDCDGTMSTYRRVGVGISGNGLGECTVKGLAAFIKEKALE